LAKSGTWFDKPAELADLLIKITDFTHSELDANCLNLLLAVEELLPPLVANPDPKNIQTHASIVS
jgi:hypothetical protein